MKQDLNHVLNSNKGKRVSFEELHIRHLNLLMDLSLFILSEMLKTRPPS